MEASTFFYLFLLYLILFIIIDIFCNEPILDLLHLFLEVMNGKVANVEPSLLFDPHGQNRVSEIIHLITCELCTWHFLDCFSIVVVLKVGNEGFEWVFFAWFDGVIDSLL